MLTGPLSFSSVVFCPTWMKEKSKYLTNTCYLSFLKIIICDSIAVRFPLLHVKCSLEFFSGVAISGSTTMEIISIIGNNIQ